MATAAGKNCDITLQSLFDTASQLINDQCEQAQESSKKHNYIAARTHVDWAHGTYRLLVRMDRAGVLGLGDLFEKIQKLRDAIFDAEMERLNRE